jgi:hypothetical protein
MEFLSLVVLASILLKVIMGIGTIPTSFNTFQKVGMVPLVNLVVKRVL